MSTPTLAIIVREMLLHSGKKKKKIPIGETDNRLSYHLGKAGGPYSDWKSNNFDPLCEKQPYSRGK